MLSCSNQEQTSQEELTSINAKASVEQDNYELNGPQIYYSSAEAEIKRLNLEKTKHVVAFENGDKEAMAQIEKIQIEIEKLNRFLDFLMIIKPIVGPRGPIPPQPCLSDIENNCNPKRKLTSKTIIVVGEELIVSKVIVKNYKNELVDTTFLPVEDSFSQSALQLKSDFKDEGVMYTTLKIKVFGEITIPTPVIGL